MDAAKDDDVGRHLRGGAGQLEAVAGEIGEILDFSLLVIMGQDGGVLFLLKILDFGDNVVHDALLVFRVAEEEPTLLDEADSSVSPIWGLTFCAVAGLQTNIEYKFLATSF